MVLTKDPIVCAYAILCLAAVCNAQYNTFDSNSNSDSEGGRILTRADLGKFARASPRGRLSFDHNQQLSQTQNPYNLHQPIQMSNSQNRRNYGMLDNNDFSNVVGAASHDRSNVDDEFNDEGDGSNVFKTNHLDIDQGASNFDNEEPSPMSLNKAATAYADDYTNSAINLGMGLRPRGFGLASEGSNLGSSDVFNEDGRRAKAASVLMGSRNYIAEDDSNLPLNQYEPHSALDSESQKDPDEDGRSSFVADGSSDGENEDE